MKITPVIAALAATVACAHAAQARTHHHRHFGQHDASRHRSARRHAVRNTARTDQQWRWRRDTYAVENEYQPSDWGASAGAEQRAHRQRARARLGGRRRRHDTYAMANEYQPSDWGASAGAERSTYHHRIGGRPAAWCGWEMRQLVGSDPGPAFNLARNWARWGKAGPAGIGAVVVWPHHVGKIVGRQNGEWVIKSGNDGHRLRTRPRSIAGVIAIRWG